MPKVYACLAGNWVCLDDDPDCKIGPEAKTPFVWWKDGGDIYEPFEREEENSYAFRPYLRITYKGVNYRIHPSFIQIVGD